MEAATISPKFQVLIPRAVREALHLRPGHKVQVIQYEDRIELILMRPVQEMRGFLKVLTPRWSGSRTAHERRGFVRLARVLRRRTLC